MSEDEGAGSAAELKGGWPREVFVHLLTFITLYLTAIAVLMLTFGLIDFYIEDPLDVGTQGLDSARVAISILVVSFPVFLFLANYVRRKTKSGQLNPSSVLRKILVYLTLLVIAVTGMVTLMITVNRFLGGELTLAFGLKALTILIVVGMVFWYYQTDLRTTKTIVATDG